MLQLSDEQFDHYRVVEKTQSWNMIWNQILWLGEVGECIQHT